MKSLFLLPVLFVVAALPLQAQPQIQWEPHPVELDEEIKDRVRFGFLLVPENRNNPDSREIYVAFTVVESYAENPLPDPVLMIAGGPGPGSSRFVNSIATHPDFHDILQKRDLVLVDQRSAGYSHPELCPNLNTAEYNVLLSFTPPERMPEFLGSAFEECKRHLDSAGADVTMYSAIEVAQDFEDLRITLGYEQWNLRGHSYGTRHGMTFIQQYPNSARSAVFSGVAPLRFYENANRVLTSRSLDILFAKCENKPDCNEAFPHLQSDLIQWLSRINSNPHQLPPQTSPYLVEGDYYITTTQIFGGLFRLLYSRQSIEVIPLFISSLADGNDWIMNNMAIPLVNTWPDSKADANMIAIQNDQLLPDPTHVSPYASIDLKNVIAEYVSSDTLGYTTYWPMLRGPSEREPETWDLTKIPVPVLLISGELDPITPPSYGEYFGAYFANAGHHVIPGAGHYPHSDAQMRFAPFFENPDPQMDYESYMEVRPLEFVTDVSLNRGVSDTVTLISIGKYQRLIIPGLAVFLCLVCLLFIPIRQFIRKTRSRPSEGLSKLKITVWLVSLLTLLVAALYGLAIMDAVNTNPYILLFGLPSKWAFIRIVIVVLVLAIAYGLMNLKPIWKSSAAVKVPALLSLAGGVVFSLFVFATGMF